ncbi:MAG TPA: pyridoxamine 5'-phosphate oxidase family protein [Anaerolineae bacterium]|nr:pyridoxamine 5'-phosphate oxidase family protein [Anaerolineae bacterium]
MKLYPQKPPMTDAELESFLSSAPIAHLGSLNPDGTIHLAALWFKYVDGEIVFGTQDKTSKVRNIKHNPNVTVLIDSEVPPFRGVLIYGQARLDYEDALAKRIAIFEKYMPPENAREAIEGLASAFTPVVIRVKPQRLSSYDYAKDGMIEAGPTSA